MQKYITILGVFLLCGCSPISKLYNNFSDFKEIKHYSDSNIPIRIFFDRYGDLYPNQFLNVTQFSDAQSTLMQYYIQNDIELKKALEAEGLHNSNQSDIKSKFLILQNHLVVQLTNEINEKSKGKKLVFFIHGYNNTGESASVDLEKLQVQILQKFPYEKFQFVEVYWDGLTKRRNLFNSVKIWDNAQYSSAMAGLGLRRILGGIRNNENYVITHSHGASVITEALFNVRRFDPDYYANDKDGKVIVELQTAYDTPSSKFIVGMLAPAIPGNNVFGEYYDRTVNGTAKVTTINNYRFINGFNKYDIATTKGFLSKYFGASTLACNEEDHENVEKRFSKNAMIYSRINFSTNTKHKQRSHAIVKYIENESFDSFLTSVFK